MLVLQEAAPNEFRDFSDMFDFIGKVKFTGLNFIKNKEINILDPGNNKEWKVSLTPSGSTLVFTRDLVQILLSQSGVKRMFTQGGFVHFDLKSGSTLNAFYGD
jgi:hypothetical protein